MKQVLLDETDRARRLLQHGSIVVGVFVLLLAARVADRPGGLPVTLALMAAGFLLFVPAFVVRQRWSIRHAGQEIRVENSPLGGERLFLDGAMVAKGQLGRRSEMRAPLASGERLLVIAEAGLTSYRCRIGLE